MPYRQLEKAIAKSSVLVKTGTTCVKKQLPFTKLTLCPNADGSSFAVIFSMSHVVANGNGYYAVQNMLADNSEIFAIDPVRNEAFFKQGPELVGKKEMASMMSTPAILNSIGCMLFGKKPTLHCFLIDEAKLTAAKEQAKGQAPFISTNDILTSGFGLASCPKMLLMAFDFRGRVEGLSDKNAGNYNGGCLYDKATYSSPAAIRSSLQGKPPYSRCDPLPGAMTRTTCKCSVITNWASMSKGDLTIPGCTQTLHVPYVVSSEACWDTAVVFKARPGQVAMMMFVKNTSVKELQEKLPLGDSLGKMFPGD